MAASSKAADSLYRDAIQRQEDFEELLAEGLVMIQQGILKSKSRHPDLPCEDSKYNINNFSKYTKEYWAFLKNHMNTYDGLDKQTLDLMHDILSKTDLRDDIGNYTLRHKTLTARSPHATTDNIELGNFQMNHNAKRNPQQLKSCSDQSNVETAVSVSSENGCNFNGMQPEFTGILKENVQQKDTENKHIVWLLLLKQHELMEISKLKEVESRLMTERLKYEEQKNSETSKKYKNILEDMRKQLSIAKSKNEHTVKQLGAILDKYECLKRRADSMKKWLTEERKQRKSCQKALKKTKRMTEELLMNRALLVEEKDTVKQFKKNIETMEEQHNKLVSTIQRTEDDKLSMRADYKNLKDQLSNAQRENQLITQALQSKELEKEQAEKSVQESQKQVKQLNEELVECKMQRETAEEQQAIMKKELKLVNDKYKVKTLRLHEKHKSCMEQLEAKRRECEALNDVVSKLKNDKHVIQEELQCVQKEKVKSELESKQEGERMREVVSMLEQERKLLLDEMVDLRKDYFSLSDRITQTLEQLEQTDVPMCITDILSNRLLKTPDTNKTAGHITSNMDMMEHIRRKLEEEENTQEKCF